VWLVLHLKRRSPVSVRRPLIAGTVLSLAAVSAWSWMASLAIGPAGPLHLSRNLLSDYGQLASAPTGNGAELFAVVAVIYAACLLVHGWRRHLQGGG
jgi:hypothetical protein